MDEGDSAEFRCQIDANPMTEDTIIWDLPDHPNEAEPGRDWKDRAQITANLEEMTSVLRLTGIERSDTGRVACIASNGVLNEQKTAFSYLKVNRKRRRPISFESLLLEVIFFLFNFRCALH